MKNEGPYLLEWVAHHKALGFDQLVVAHNDCSDGTARMLRRLTQMGIVSHHRTHLNTMIGVHRSALKQGRARLAPDDNDWVFVCDTDEFLNVHVGDNSVQALIEHSGPDSDIISIPWRIFGQDGQRDFVDARITRQFLATERPYVDAQTTPLTGKWMKSISRNNSKYKRQGIHHPVVSERHEKGLQWVMAGGAPQKTAEDRAANPPSWAAAQINHYALRSLDSYLVKRDRGRANHMNETLGLEYHAKFDLNHEIDTSVLRYEAATSVIYEYLMSDKTLRDLHLAAVDWHRRKVAAMRADAKLEPVIAALEASCAQNALRLHDWDAQEVRRAG